MLGRVRPVRLSGPGIPPRRIALLIEIVATETHTLQGWEESRPGWLKNLNARCLPGPTLVGSSHRPLLAKGTPLGSNGSGPRTAERCVTPRKSPPDPCGSG